jgi:glycosyltransferase involved in cell wall biosynthesis
MMPRRQTSSSSRRHIAEVSKADFVGGGASAIATLLASGLRMEGNPVLHYCLYAGGGFDYWRRPIGGHSSRLFMDENLSLKANESLADVIPLEAGFFQNELERFPIELFHFHDLTSAISPLTLDRLSQQVPVIWTLHDFSPFTGGCIYPMGCERWLTEPACMSCPQHGQWPLDTAVDTAWINRNIKKHIHKNKKIHLVSPSQWLADQFKRSGILEKNITIIPNGIDGSPFSGIDKISARKKIGVSENEFVACFSSGNLADPRKNIIHSIEAIKNINVKRKKIIVLGHRDKNISDLFEGLDVISPGFIYDRRVLAEYLKASDIFLFTSLAENHPLSTLEAMAAGTCVVGYATGGVQEQLTHGVNALLVAPDDREGLLAMAGQLGSREPLLNFGLNARHKYEQEFTLSMMVERYLSFFDRVCSGAEG